MSILKTTHAGSKAIPVTDDRTIYNEIEKLGYTYNSTLRCWFCSKNSLPDIVIAHLYGSDGSNIFNHIFNVYIFYATYNSTTHCITTMYDLFNFIKDLKPICQS